jgi:hypothetical protein
VLVREQRCLRRLCTSFRRAWWQPCSSSVTLYLPHPSPYLVVRRSSRISPNTHCSRPHDITSSRHRIPYSRLNTWGSAQRVVVAAPSPICCPLSRMSNRTKQTGEESFKYIFNISVFDFTSIKCPENSFSISLFDLKTHQSLRVAVPKNKMSRFALLVLSP